jgi:UDP-perosamine 4-acetyltransferase
VKPAVIGFGAGGHAAVLVETLQLDGEYEIVGLLDVEQSLHGTSVLGVPVLGTDELLPALYRKGVRLFFVGVGSVGDARARERLYVLGLDQGLEPIRVLHPRALVSRSTKLGRGAAILAGAIVNSRAEIGENVIVNSGAIIEHDCIVGSHAHVAPGAALAGGVNVGEGAHVGIGATIREGLRVGARAVVGAGAAVTKDVPENTTVVGVPARYLKHNEL